MSSEVRFGLRTLLIAGAAVAILSAAHGSGELAEEPGVSGSVLQPDGAPVSAGRVVIEAPGARNSAPIDEAGRFRVIPDAPGVRVLAVTVPGFAPYRLGINVPRSRTVMLPPIRMSPGTYFRARFVTADGEPIMWPQLRRRSFDAAGPVTPAMPDDGVEERMDGGGTITIGPLPRGLTTLAFDTPPLARIRLPDLSVTGEKPLVDVGTIVAQTGATLQVDVVDEQGAPVPQHRVLVEDVRPQSPLAWLDVRTSPEGRAAFDRLGAGKYRLRTSAIARCAGGLLSIAPVVAMSGSGTVRVRLAVGGRATFRLHSTAGPMKGVRINAAPDTGSAASPISFRVRPRGSPVTGRSIPGSSCEGTTDEAGRVTLLNFPPGPADVAVRLLNSTYVRHVEVPIDGSEIPIGIPGGFLPVRVTSTARQTPIPGAKITWTASGARVEAVASATGEALLDGVGTAGGTLAVEAPGHEPAEEMLPEPSPALHEVALARTPDRHVEARVVAASGVPVSGAVVLLTSADPMHIPRVAITDASGSIRFAAAPAGTLRLTVSTDGVVRAAAAIGEEHRTGIVLTVDQDR
jgi:carboxypeptidase family protein